MKADSSDHSNICASDFCVIFLVWAYEVTWIRSIRVWSWCVSSITIRQRWDCIIDIYRLVIIGKHVIYMSEIPDEIWVPRRLKLLQHLSNLVKCCTKIFFPKKKLLPHRHNHVGTIQLQLHLFLISLFYLIIQLYNISQRAIIKLLGGWKIWIAKVFLRRKSL